MAGEAVKLLGMWASPFSLRVRWVLHLKEIEYEYVEEDLQNKSPRLLQYNPVYKKIPVLLHGEKNIAESLVIIEYLDEVWKNNPILPEDPYERAMARFWAKYADEKCFPAIFGAFAKTGEDQEKCIKEGQECLKVLEGALHGKKFFGGETIGLVDIAVGLYGYWIPLVEETVGIKIIEDSNLPLLTTWFQDFLALEVVKEILPPRENLISVLKALRTKLGAVPV
ncbi:glutathione transferase GST 23-like [Aristolochia californica]|uniref:glutathione transferase GST 23-like n=1 Tax=Aristolochia californica TaxID=171875 RepID=UPI0035DA9029